MTIEDLIRSLDNDAIQLILKGHADCQFCADTRAVCLSHTSEDADGEFFFGCDVCCGHGDEEAAHFTLDEVFDSLKVKFKI